MQEKWRWEKAGQVGLESGIAFAGDWKAVIEGF